MHHGLVIAFATLLLTLQVRDEPKSVPLGTGRPDTPGIARTTLRDDERASVVRVEFSPGASEVPHTHPYDIIVIAVSDGDATFVSGERSTKVSSAGTVEFVPKGVVHQLKNQGRNPLRVVTVALK